MSGGFRIKSRKWILITCRDHVAIVGLLQLIDSTVAFDQRTSGARHGNGNDDVGYAGHCNDEDDVGHANDEDDDEAGEEKEANEATKKKEEAEKLAAANKKEAAEKSAK
ncbi:hypothetical protein Tco_0370293 [Tanacetum coccineum]